MPNKPLTIGKLRGLTATSTSDGAFAILAFDHRQSFAKMLNPRQPDSVTYEDMVAVKSQVVRALARHASAVLLDPVVGAAQTIANGSLPGNSGLLVAIEETGYGGETTARVSSILEGWSESKVKRMGADAIKLLIYYNPRVVDLARRQEHLVRTVAEACAQEDLVFYLEPVTYSHAPDIKKESPQFAAERPGLIVETAQILSELQPEVLKLEFPVDPNFDKDEDNWRKACEQVSKVSSCPWTLLSQAVEYSLFVRLVEVACQSGASGFIAGRAVWQEAIAMPDSSRQKWLEQVAASRLDELTSLANRFARPWRSFYTADENSLSDQWYKSYSS